MAEIARSRLTWHRSKEAEKEDAVRLGKGRTARTALHATTLADERFTWPLANRNIGPQLWLLCQILLMLNNMRLVLNLLLDCLGRATRQILILEHCTNVRISMTPSPSGIISEISQRLTEGQLFQRTAGCFWPEQEDQDSLNGNPAAVDKEVFPADSRRACIQGKRLCQQTEKLSKRRRCADLPIGLTLVPKNWAAFPKNWKTVIPRALWANGKISTRNAIEYVSKLLPETSHGWSRSRSLL